MSKRNSTSSTKNAYDCSGQTGQDLIGRSVAIRPHTNVGDDLHAAFFAPFEGGTSNMGKGHHIRMTDQAGIDMRLVRIDIETCSRKFSGL